jgi:hypothetical protein
MPAQTVIKLRRGTASQWTTANPVLGAGEMGVETDTNKFKFGDGATAWTSLAYGVASASGSTTVEWTDVLNKPSTFTPSAHTHAISDVTSLQTSLDGKAATVHTHAISDTTGLQTALDGKAPTVHTHAISDTTGLQTALDGKQAIVSGVSDTEIGYLDGVTSAIQTQLNGKAATSHTHLLADITDYVAPTSGGMTLISSTTLAAGANTATLSSIPQTYKKLELEINFTGGVGGPSTVTMTFNGTTGGYSWGYPVYGGSTGSGQATASFNWGISQTASIFPGITSGSTHITIPNYTSTTQYKNYQFFSYTGYITSTVNNGAGIWGSYSNSFSPINSIGLTFSNITGSTVYTIKLWGVN